MVNYSTEQLYAYHHFTFPTLKQSYSTMKSRRTCFSWNFANFGAPNKLSHWYKRYGISMDSLHVLCICICILCLMAWFHSLQLDLQFWFVSDLDGRNCILNFSSLSTTWLTYQDSHLQLYTVVVVVVVYYMLLLLLLYTVLCVHISIHVS